mmetsp:Transcript_41417/g.125402  ORF Transcript_41417/g.125402 Transcript_41417/m.125402 type:complete len:218 (+) Transcript_41417:704-1357(+)
MIDRSPHKSIPRLSFLDSIQPRLLPSIVLGQSVQSVLVTNAQPVRRQIVPPLRGHAQQRHALRLAPLRHAVPRQQAYSRVRHAPRASAIRGGTIPRVSPGGIPLQSPLPVRVPIPQAAHGRRIPVLHAPKRGAEGVLVPQVFLPPPGDDPVDRAVPHQLLDGVPCDRVGEKLGVHPFSRDRRFEPPSALLGYILFDRAAFVRDSVLGRDGIQRQHVR